MSQQPQSDTPESAPQAPPTRGRLADRTVCLCVTGSIAAYKAAALARLLGKEGADVQVVMTTSAKKFVGPATFQGLTGNPVLDDMWDGNVGGEIHVDLAASSDLIIIMPATADTLARLAQGRADDLVTATALCARCPILAVPAMHPSMWAHPATQRNVATLTGDERVTFVGPTHGEVASGDRGLGRMVEPESVLAAAIGSVSTDGLLGKHVVVTAGPTVEDIDPVRFLSNRSTGRMGFAVAERAAARGARVTLITGPVTLPTPWGVHRVDVRSAVAMRGAVWQALGPDLSHADALIMTAAVGDFRPAETHSSKLKRGDRKTMKVELVQNPDIISEVGLARQSTPPLLIAFAVETEGHEELVAYAQRKLEQKRVDLVVANHAENSFGRDDNLASFVEKESVHPLPHLKKADLADRILDWTLRRLDNPSRDSSPVGEE